MKYKNESTNEIVESKNYAEEFAYSHNSNWKKLEEKDTKKNKE
ncbi:MAG: hypothetical protein ACI4ON_00405 [Clostridia bacterium]